MPVEETTAAAAAANTIRASRTEILDDDTPATFGDVNWNYRTSEAKNGASLVAGRGPRNDVAGSYSLYGS
jgi:hypothetical protein